MVSRPTESLSRALRTKREANVMRSAGGSASHELRRWRGLAIKSRPLPPQMQGLPMDSDDDGERHRRVAEEAAQHGAVVERLAAAADRGRQHQAIGVVVIHIDMGIYVVQPEAEAKTPLDGKERRKMKGLEAFTPGAGVVRHVFPRPQN